MDYYPDQRYLLEMATIRREQMLPDDAIGDVEVREDATVNLRDIVARGVIPSRYIIIDAVTQLGLKDPTQVDDLLLVERDTPIKAGTPVAGDAKRRRRQIIAPTDCVLTHVESGRLILQITPEAVEIEAGVDGKVVKVIPKRGVVVETFGALIQGVWGNNRRVVGPLLFEPDGGLGKLDADLLDLTYRGSVLVTQSPIRSVDLMSLLEQGINGLIAPSMDVALLPTVLATRKAIMLTEGFGAIKMASSLARLLKSFNGKPVMLDAVLPDRWTERRPEAIINPSSRAAYRPPRPNVNMKLEAGISVRLTRLPYFGQVGKVLDLPKMPILLENGLRLMCAQVELAGGEKVMIPLANMEVFGR